MSTLKGAVTPTTIANLVRLLRAPSPRRSFLLLEGRWDSPVFDLMVDRTVCEPVVCCGRENVIGAILLLERQNFKGALGVVDADYCYETGQVIAGSNICVTDLNDMECMLISSPAFERVLGVHGSAEKVKDAESLYKLPIREVLYREAATLGAIRLVAKQNEWPLKFQGMSYSFVSGNGIETHRAKIIEGVINRSGAGVGIDEVSAACDALPPPRGGDLALCSGDDLCRILARGLKMLIGSYAKFDTNPLELKKALLLAFDTAWFAGTLLYQGIRRWEAANPPFRILR